MTTNLQRLLQGTSMRITPRIRFDYSIRLRRVTAKQLPSPYDRIYLGSGTISSLTRAILTLTGQDTSRPGPRLKVFSKFELDLKILKSQIYINYFFNDVNIFQLN